VNLRTAAVLLALAASLLTACAEEPTTDASTPSGEPVVWGEREPVVYAVVVAEVLDDLGAPPPVVFVVDGVCRQAGQVEPDQLSCAGAIPEAGKRALTSQLERYVDVRFVPTAEAAADGGAVRDGGLLFWLGPLKDRKGGEVRVGANYASELASEDPLGVNLALEERAGSWTVTGAAGLGGCPA
jgi:hypothetical protein